MQYRAAEYNVEVTVVEGEMVCVHQFENWFVCRCLGECFTFLDLCVRNIYAVKLLWKDAVAIQSSPLSRPKLQDPALMAVLKCLLLYFLTLAVGPVTAMPKDFPVGSTLDRFRIVGFLFSLRPSRNVYRHALTPSDFPLRL